MTNAVQTKTIRANLKTFGGRMKLNRLLRKGWVVAAKRDNRFTDWGRSDTIFLTRDAPSTLTVSPVAAPIEAKPYGPTPMIPRTTQTTEQWDAYVSTYTAWLRAWADRIDHEMAPADVEA